MNIIYLGFNSFKEHKRGVENVIDFQSRSSSFKLIYYVHWGTSTKVYKNNQFICISIKSCWYWPIILSLVVNLILKKYKCTIHSHNALFTVFGLFKTNLFTVHDGLYYQNNAIKNKKAIFWIIEKILYRRCSFVHFISYFTKDQSLYGARKNYKVIPNSSNLESLIDTTLYNHLNLPKNYVLIVKSFEERARFDLLMDVARRLKNTSFVVAGKGPLLGFYQSYIEKNDIHNVKILGYVDDITLINLYRQCSTVMNIAEYGEGFGLPIIEGYLFNKPVIASDKCAIPEVIISVEFLFENNAESIIKVYEKTLNLLTKDYKSFYDLRYSNEIISKQLNILYHSL